MRLTWTLLAPKFRSSPTLVFGAVRVMEELRFVLPRQRRNRLDFTNDGLVDNNIREIDA